MIRDYIAQTAIITVGCAATSFALVFLIKFGIKQESLFALIGAVIGASATIGGAAWLADRNRVVDRETEAALLVEEYGKLLKEALAAQAKEPDAGMDWPEEYRPRLYTLAETAGDVHAIASEALLHAKAISFIHRAEVRRVQFAINEYLSFWTAAQGDLDPMDERSFPSVTADIINECRLAIAQLERR